jgi:hypothetical protein
VLFTFAISKEHLMEPSMFVIAEEVMLPSVRGVMNYFFYCHMVIKEWMNRFSLSFEASP